RSTHGVLPGLLGDGLVDELAEQLLELALPRAGLRLSHQDGDELLLGIDPERGAAGAAPRELAGRARRAVQTIGAAGGEAADDARSRRGRGAASPSSAAAGPAARRGTGRASRRSPPRRRDRRRPSTCRTPTSFRAGEPAAPWRGSRAAPPG